MSEKFPKKKESVSDFFLFFEESYCVLAKCPLCAAVTAMAAVSGCYRFLAPSFLRFPYTASVSLPRGKLIPILYRALMKIPDRSFVVSQHRISRSTEVVVEFAAIRAHGWGEGDFAAAGGSSRRSVQGSSVAI